MAAGEYISMQSQRELFERQIALERAEMEAMPEEEEAELAAAYRCQGLHARGGRPHRHRIFADPEDGPRHRSSARSWVSTPTSSARRSGPAAGSFVAFAVGAAVPVIPYLFGGGTAVVAREPGPEPGRAVRGRAPRVSLLTGRSLLFSGFRQLLIGLGAAVVTYAIGSLIGVAVT